MSYITLKCKSCGSNLNIDHDSKTITCVHCGTTFMMVDLLDEHDIAFSKNIKPEDLEKKIEFAEALKQGETYLFQAEYKLAEQSFKKAIELNNENYKGYFGVVRAKTHNLNIIPDEKDYLEYVKQAVKFVDKDDQVYLENELIKLDFLKQEKAQQKKVKLQQTQQQERAERHIRETETFFGYVTMFLIVFMTVVLLSLIFMTGLIYDPTAPSKASTYEVSSKTELVNILQKEDLLSSNIVITKDIDFENSEWTPIGSKQTPFTGKIYGNGHKISNIKITPTEGEGNIYTGFVAYAKDANISGLSFYNASISQQEIFDHQTTNHIAIVCGYAENTKFSKCSIYKNCSITLDNQNKNIAVVGGLVAKSVNSKIAYSYANADISVTISNIATTASQASAISYHIGGLVGEFKSSKITNSYSASNITTNLSSQLTSLITLNIGGLVGYWHTQTSLEDLISNSFFTGDLTSSIESLTNHTNMAGIIAYGSNADHMSSNFAILSADSYTVNSTNLTTAGFGDYSDRPTSVKYISASTILETIEQSLDNSIWTNLTTLTPTLRTSN